jgi:hypothetical protein
MNTIFQVIKLGKSAMNQAFLVYFFKKIKEFVL